MLALTSCRFLMLALTSCRFLMLALTFSPFFHGILMFRLSSKFVFVRTLLSALRHWLISPCILMFALSFQFFFCANTPRAGVSLQLIADRVPSSGFSLWFFSCSDRSSDGGMHILLLSISSVSRSSRPLAAGQCSPRNARWCSILLTFCCSALFPALCSLNIFL